MKKFLQDSDVLSRRALLGGTVSLGASALLAACGQQVNNEAVAD
jgi:lipoprotein